MTAFELAITVFIPTLWVGSMATAVAFIRAAWESPIGKYGTLYVAINATVIIVAVAFHWTILLAWVFLTCGAL